MKILPIGHLVKANPIQTQSNPISEKAKMNINSFITKDYRKKADFIVRINKPNLRNTKMNANVYVIEDYENKTAFRPQKNKPNSNPIKACPERIEFTLSVIEGNGPISNARIPCKNNAICYT